MSEYYYLDCKTCKEAIFVTNNKGDPPDREMMKVFLLRHGWTKPKCKVILECEVYWDDHNHIKNFDEIYKKEYAQDTVK